MPPSIRTRCAVGWLAHDEETNKRALTTWDEQQHLQRVVTAAARAIRHEKGTITNSLFFVRCVSLGTQRKPTVERMVASFLRRFAATDSIFSTSRSASSPSLLPTHRQTFVADASCFVTRLESWCCAVTGTRVGSRSDVCRVETATGNAVNSVHSELQRGLWFGRGPIE